MQQLDAWLAEITEAPANPTRPAPKPADYWTPDDATTLQSCEAKIARYEQSFRHTGDALWRIQRYRLYRKSHETFEQYVDDRWEMSPAHAYRLIEAAKLMERLAESLQFGEKDTLPTCESQVRELLRLKKATQQILAWQEIVQRKRADGVRITAKLIGQKVDATLEIDRKRPKPQKPEPAPIKWKKYGRKIAAFMFEFGVSPDEMLPQVHDAILVWLRQERVTREEAAAILREVAQKLLAA